MNGGAAMHLNVYAMRFSERLFRVRGRTLRENSLLDSLSSERCANLSLDLRPWTLIQPLPELTCAQGVPGRVVLPPEPTVTHRANR